MRFAGARSGRGQFENFGDSACLSQNASSDDQQALALLRVHIQAEIIGHIMTSYTSRAPCFLLHAVAIAVVSMQPRAQHPCSLKPARTCTDSMYRMYAPLLVPRRPHVRRMAQSSAAGRAPWPCFLPHARDIARAQEYARLKVFFICVHIGVGTTLRRAGMTPMCASEAICTLTDVCRAVGTAL